MKRNNKKNNRLIIIIILEKAKYIIMSLCSVIYSLDNQVA